MRTMLGGGVRYAMARTWALETTPHGNTVGIRKLFAR